MKAPIAGEVVLRLEPSQAVLLPVRGSLSTINRDP